MLAQSDELYVYILPLVGSLLLSYGIFQAVNESRSSTRKKMKNRLAGETQSLDPKLEKSFLSSSVRSAQSLISFGLPES